MTNGYTNGKSVADVLNDFKEEIKEFATTRLQMLRNELREKMSSWSTAIPMMAVGLVFLVIALLLFTGFLVALIALAFAGRPWAYAISFAIVAVLYGLVGAVSGLYGYRTLKSAGVAPERTLRVLKQDGIWLRTETRTQV